jgi:hypothetical protein
MDRDTAYDEWELKLDDKLKELKLCQDTQRVHSCLDCNMLFNCNTRDSYVHAVYSSMNKGASGGFEF